jgi:hypothetical protein
VEVEVGKGMFKEAVWCIVTLNSQDKLLVGCVYRSPNIFRDDDEQLNDMIIQASNFKVSHKLIMGDFNHPEIDWRNETCQQAQDHPATLFLEAIKDTFFYQHSIEPTHFRPGQRTNTLDLIFTNEEGMVGMEWNERVLRRTMLHNLG